jgi:hypothetical protein
MRVALQTILEAADFPKPTACTACAFSSPLEARRRTVPGLTTPQGMTWCRMLGGPVADGANPICTHEDWRDQAREEARQQQG